MGECGSGAGNSLHPTGRCWPPSHSRRGASAGGKHQLHQLAANTSCSRVFSHSTSSCSTSRGSSRPSAARLLAACSGARGRGSGWWKWGCHAWVQV